jgi:hypothetical protein
MWPFKTRPPEKFPFTAAMMCMTIRDDRWIHHLLGFERKLMCKGERGGVRAKVPFDIRPRKLLIAEETGPFFIIDSIRVDAIEQMVAGSRISASVFSHGSAMDCDFATAKADQWVSIDMTCVGRATLGQRTLSRLRTILWMLWYRVRYSRFFTKREVIPPYVPSEDGEDEA